MRPCWGPTGPAQLVKRPLGEQPLLNRQAGALTTAPSPLGFFLVTNTSDALIWRGRFSNLGSHFEQAKKYYCATFLSRNISNKNNIRFWPKMNTGIRFHSGGSELLGLDSNEVLLPSARDETQL